MSTQGITWGVLLRVLLKAALLFGLCNLLYALVPPSASWERLSVYGTLVPPRARLPYSDNPAQSYSVSLNSLTPMLAAHAVARPKAPDEFRVILLGDSSVWGWFLPPTQTYAAHINAAGALAPDGRRVVAYNLAYPIMSLSKDLLILDAVRAMQPDAVVWLVSLESFGWEKQTFPPLVQHNRDALQPLIAAYNLPLDTGAFVVPSVWGRSLVGDRRRIADWLRLQLYGVSWAATGTDQYIPLSYTPTPHDLTPTLAWGTFSAPTTLTAQDLAFDVLATGVAHMGDVPVWVINAPIFIANGENSNLRYNSLYPRWVYDQYRTLLAEIAQNRGWWYTDWWDMLPPENFTDSPVHLSATGAQQVSTALLGRIFSQTED